MDRSVSAETWYVSGPMRGYRQWNYPAFDDASAYLTRRGHNVISPADIDRELGIDENSEELPDWFTIEDAMRRDLAAVTECDKMILLDGWQKSVGATREVLTAVWCGLPVYGFINQVSPYVIPLPHKNILDAIDDEVAFRENP